MIIDRKLIHIDIERSKEKSENSAFTPSIRSQFLSSSFLYYSVLPSYTNRNIVAL